jgi:carbon monoxide dehydrogenase subunit G
MSEIDAPTQYRLTVSGEGQQSIISGTAIIRLEAKADAAEGKPETIVSWTAEGSLAGKLASVAQRLIQVAASLLSRQFFGALAKQLGAAELPTTDTTFPAVS